MFGWFRFCHALISFSRYFFAFSSKFGVFSANGNFPSFLLTLNTFANPPCPNFFNGVYVFNNSDGKSGIVFVDSGVEVGLTYVADLIFGFDFWFRNFY